MRLSPVYLVDPRDPTPANKASRRAFLVFGGTFLSGLGCGLVATFAAPVRASSGDASEPPRAAVDPRLERLREVCRDGSIDELIAAEGAILFFLESGFANDQALWTGVERVCGALLRLADYPRRRTVARRWARAIDNAEAPPRRLLPLARRLTEVR